MWYNVCLNAKNKSHDAAQKYSSLGHASLGLVTSISMYIGERNLLYGVASNTSTEGEDRSESKLILEDDLCYAPKCPVHIQLEKQMEGEIISCCFTTGWGDKTKNKSYTVVCFGERDFKILYSDEDIVKYRRVVSEQNKIKEGTQKEIRNKADENEQKELNESAAILERDRVVPDVVQPQSLPPAPQTVQKYQIEDGASSITDSFDASLSMGTPPASSSKKSSYSCSETTVAAAKTIMSSSKDATPTTPKKSELRWTPPSNTVASSSPSSRKRPTSAASSSTPLDGTRPSKSAKKSDSNATTDTISVKETTTLSEHGDRGNQRCVRLPYWLVGTEDLFNEVQSK